MTDEERKNAIRCLKKWIEKEPYLQTYKTCLEALEATSPCDVVESTKIKAMQELINESYCKGFIYGKEEGLRETKQKPKVTTTSTDEPMVICYPQVDEPMVMQYPQVDGITPTVVKAEQEPINVKKDTVPVKLRINKVSKHISNIDLDELEQEPADKSNLEKICEELAAENDNLIEAYKQVCKERDIAIEQLHELGYELGQKIEPCDDVVSRQAVLDCATLITSIPTEDWDIGDWVCLFRDRVSQLPSARPQEPKICEKCLYAEETDGSHCYECVKGESKFEPQESEDKE